MACMWSAIADPKSCDQNDNRCKNWTVLLQIMPGELGLSDIKVLTKSIVIVIKVSEVFHVGGDV